MPSRDRNAWGSEEGEQAFYKEAQERILSLKKHRSEQLTKIQGESKAAMEELRKEIIAHQDDQQIKKSQAYTNALTTLVETTERRRDIEERMGAVVAKMNAHVKEMEDMIEAGCVGREKEAEETKVKLLKQQI